MYRFSSHVLANFPIDFVVCPGFQFQSSLPYQPPSTVPESTLQAGCDTNYALSPLDMCSSPVCVFRIKICNRCLYLSHFRLIFLIWCSRTLSQCVMWCSNRNCNTFSYIPASSQQIREKRAHECSQPGLLTSQAKLQFWNREVNFGIIASYTCCIYTINSFVFDKS